jgi:hypothetical protein
MTVIQVWNDGAAVAIGATRDCESRWNARHGRYGD